MATAARLEVEAHGKGLHPVRLEQLNRSKPQGTNCSAWVHHVETGILTVRDEHDIGRVGVVLKGAIVRVSGQKVVHDPEQRGAHVIQEGRIFGEETSLQIFIDLVRLALHQVNVDRIHIIAATISCARLRSTADGLIGEGREAVGQEGVGLHDK
jgi:hypothetical protein